jgi:hypothetical protein
MGSSRQRWSLPLSCQNRLAGPTREGGTFGLRLGVWNCCAGFSPKFIACYAQRLDTLATRPMKTVAIAIMTMVLLLVAGYLLGAALGLIFGLVSTAATKVLYLWNDDKFAPQRRGGRRVQEQDAPELVAILRDLARRAGMPTHSPLAAAGGMPRSASPRDFCMHSHVTSSLECLLTSWAMCSVAPP